MPFADENAYELFTCYRGGGSIALWLAYLLPDPAEPGLIPSIPEKISEGNTVDVAEVYQSGCLEESGQWLEHVA